MSDAKGRNDGVLQNVMRLFWWLLLLFLFPGQVAFGSYGAAAALVVTLLALPLLLRSESRRLLMANRWLFLFPIAYLLLVVPFFFTAEEPHDLIYAANFLAFLLCLPAFVIARQQAGNRAAFQIIAFALAANVLGMGIALAQTQYFGMNRAQGYMSNANMFAHLVVLFGFVALPGFYMTRKWWRVLFLAGPVIGVAVAILAGSRGALLSAAPVAILAFIYLVSRPGGRRWIFAGLITAALGVGALIALDYDASAPIQRAMSVQNVITRVLEGKKVRDWSTFMRIELYKGGVRAFTESPIIGHGWQDAVQVAAEQIPGQTKRYRRTNAQLAARWPNMHNDFLGFAAGSGIFGIASFVLLFAAPFVALRKPRDELKPHLNYLIWALVIVTFTHGLINAPLGHDMGVDSFALLTVLFAGALHLKFDGEESPQTA